MKKHNLTKVELLELTLAAYKERKEPSSYICISISNIHYNHVGTYDDGGIDSFLRHWISGLFNSGDDENTYDTWLETHHNAVYKKMSHDDMHEGRTQWLEWMVQYWKEQENKNV